MRSIFHTVLLIGLLFSSATFAAPPSEPGDFRFAVYSDSAAELFWSRSVDSDGVVRGYEIRRNGELVTTIDALSYFTDDLTPGEVNTFTVAAVDFDGEQSSTASVSVTTGGEIPIDATQPSVPTNLRDAVYADTIAEIFWDRVFSEFLIYEISLDGVVVQTTSGTSHVFVDLAPGSTSLIDVVAINTNGLRSGAANISITTSGNSITPPSEEPPQEPPEEPFEDDDTLPEIRPQNLSIVVYSSTAAELFWTPNATFRPRVFANEIRRDGVLIDTVEGEFLRSYFDPSREPGISYTYVVTAVSSAGRGSATITGPGFNNVPNTEPDPGVTDIPAETIQRLDTMFSIVNGTTIETAVATSSRLTDRDFRDEAGFEFVGEAPIVEGEPITIMDDFLLVFSCPDGGELLELQEAGVEIDTGRFSPQVVADDCKVGPITTSGVFGGGTTDFEPGVSFSFRSTGSSFAGVNINDERDASTIEIRFLGFSPDPEFPTLFGYNTLSATFTSDTLSWSASAINNQPTDNLTVLPDGTFGMTIRAETVTGIYDSAVLLESRGAIEFANGRELGRPTAGSLFVGSDEESLLLTFSNGDPDSFTLTETAGGTTISYTLPFDDQYRIDAINPAEVDIGF